MSEGHRELMSYYEDGNIYATTEYVCLLHGIDRKTLLAWGKKGLKKYKKTFSRSNLYILQEVEEWKRNNLNFAKSQNAKKEIGANVNKGQAGEDDAEEDMDTILERYENEDINGKRRILRKIGTNKLDELKKGEDILREESKNKEYDNRYALVDKVKKGQQELATLFMSFLKTSMPVLSKDLEDKKQDEIYHELDRYFGKEIKSIVKFIEIDTEIVITLHDIIMLIVKLVSKEDIKIENIIKTLNKMSL